MGAALAITSCAFYNFCIPYIANGEGDIAKHLFSYIQSADFIVMLLIYLLLDGVIINVSIFERISKRKRVLIPVALACGFCIILVSYGLAALTSSRKTGMIGPFIELG